MSDRTGPTGSSAGGFAERPFEQRPMDAPRERYGIESSVKGIVAATFNWWAGDIARLVVIGIIPFLIVLGAGVALAIPMGISFGSAFVGSGGSDVQGLSMWMTVAAIAAFAGVAMVAFFGAQAASIAAVEDHAKFQHSFGAWDAFLQGVASLKRILPAIVLLYVGAIVAAIPFGILQWFGDIIGGLGSVAFGIFVCWVCLRMAPLIPVYAIEDKPLIEGFARAWQLTSGKSLRILGAGIVFGFVMLGLWIFLGVIMAFMSFFGTLLAPFVMLVISPIMHVFAFAVYASCVNDEIGGA